ncbi:unnamed protein product [Amoebophrya sp. A120]|nr:unnamed protein product [Amoebophrya sp. A120]|eukprot:GSA120T00011322001.1
MTRIRGDGGKASGGKLIFCEVCTEYENQADALALLDRLKSFVLALPRVSARPSVLEELPHDSENLGYCVHASLDTSKSGVRGKNGNKRTNKRSGQQRSSSALIEDEEEKRYHAATTHGAVISIKLRRSGSGPTDYLRFLPFPELLATFCHELAHLETNRNEHDEAFYQSVASTCECVDPSGKQYHLVRRLRQEIFNAIVEKDVARVEAILAHLFPADTKKSPASLWLHPESRELSAKLAAGGAASSTASVGGLLSSKDNNHAGGTTKNAPSLRSPSSPRVREQEQQEIYPPPHDDYDPYPEQQSVLDYCVSYPDVNICSLLAKKIYSRALVQRAIDRGEGRIAVVQPDAEGEEAGENEVDMVRTSSVKKTEVTSREEGASTTATTTLTEAEESSVKACVSVLRKRLVYLNKISSKRAAKSHQDKIRLVVDEGAEGEEDALPFTSAVSAGVGGPEEAAQVFPTGAGHDETTPQHGFVPSNPRAAGDSVAAASGDASSFPASSPFSALSPSGKKSKRSRPRAGDVSFSPYADHTTGFCSPHFSGSSPYFATGSSIQQSLSANALTSVPHTWLGASIPHATLRWQASFSPTHRNGGTATGGDYNEIGEEFAIAHTSFVDTKKQEQELSKARLARERLWRKRRKRRVLTTPPSKEHQWKSEQALSLSSDPIKYQGPNSSGRAAAAVGGNTSSSKVGPPGGPPSKPVSTSVGPSYLDPSFSSYIDVDAAASRLAPPPLSEIARNLAGAKSMKDYQAALSPRAKDKGKDKEKAEKKTSSKSGSTAASNKQSKNKSSSASSAAPTGLNASTATAGEHSKSNTLPEQQLQPSKSKTKSKSGGSITTGATTLSFFGGKFHLDSMKEAERKKAASKSKVANDRHGIELPILAEDETTTVEDLIAISAKKRRSSRAKALAAAAQKEAVRRAAARGGSDSVSRPPQNKSSSQDDSVSTSVGAGGGLSGSSASSSFREVEDGTLDERQNDSGIANYNHQTERLRLGPPPAPPFALAREKKAGRRGAAVELQEEEDHGDGRGDEQGTGSQARRRNNLTRHHLREPDNLERVIAKHWSADRLETLADQQTILAAASGFSEREVASQKTGFLRTAARTVSNLNAVHMLRKDVRRKYSSSDNVLFGRPL